MIRWARHVAAAACIVAAGGCADYVGEDLRSGEYPRHDAIAFDEVAAAADDRPAPPRPRPTDPRSLEVGACFDDLGERPLRDFGLGDPVGVVPCSAPHRYELFARPALADPAVTAWPGDARAEELADLACVEAFESVIGIPWSDSTLDYLTLAPTEQGWVSGDTHAACAAFDLGLVPLEEPVTDSRR